MANVSDFHNGTSIAGATAFRRNYGLNGQVVFDSGIQPATVAARIDFSNDNTKCVVSGTMGSLSKDATTGELKFVPIVAALKGVDALYILASKEVGAYKCYDKTNTKINYFKYLDKEKVSLLALDEGMRVYLRCDSNVTIGQELCPVSEYMVSPTVAGVAGYAKIFIAESSASANELVLCRVRRNGVSA